MQLQKSMTLVFAAALLAPTAACQPTGQQGDMDGAAAVDTAALTATLDSMRVAFETAYEAGDFEAMASYYAPDATVSFPGTGVLSGREAIGAAMEQEYAQGARLSIDPEVVRIIDSDWVYEMGTGTVSFTPEGADEPQEVSSIHLAVFHRTDQGWRIVNEVIGADSPPPSSDM